MITIFKENDTLDLEDFNYKDLINVLMKKVIRRVIFEILFLKTICKVTLHIKDKKYIIIVGTPIHGNIGDQAIALAEEEFIAECGYKFLEIPSPYFRRVPWLWKSLIKNKNIYLHGGGYIGDLYPKEEEMFESVLKTFQNNRVFIFPQTIYVKEDDKFIERVNRILSKCRKVALCTREKYSYDYAKKNLNFTDIFLIPDIVLSRNWSITNNKHRREINICLREDEEKSIKHSTLINTTKLINEQFPGLYSKVTDTMLKDSIILPGWRKRIVTNKIRELSEAAIIITDRLHGMVFSAFAQRPTIVFSNNNYKVKGVYQWIKNNNWIVYCDKDEFLDVQIKQLNLKYQYKYDNDSVKAEFKLLKGMVYNDTQD